MKIKGSSNIYLISIPENWRQFLGQQPTSLSERLLNLEVGQQVITILRLLRKNNHHSEFYTQQNYIKH